MDDVIEERGATLHLNPGVCVLVAQSCLTVCNPLDPARQDLLSMGFSRQGYQSGLPFPSPGDFSASGIRLGSPTLKAESFLSEPPGKLNLPMWPSKLHS